MTRDESTQTSWLHFTEQTQEELRALLEQLHIHPLARQLLLNGSDFPKIDVYDECVFVSLAFVHNDWQISQLQCIVTKQQMISYAQSDEETFVRQVQEKLSRHPEHALHPSLILYEFFDVLTFRFLHMVDEISNEIQKLEKQVFKTPFENDIGRNVYRWKVRLHELRQIVEAQEEMMKVLHHPNFPHMSEGARPYLQDVTSRFSRITAALDTLKETLSGIFDLQLSLKSDHMNVIMKTLTLVSVIFMPMTFVAGVYGMNFQWMPELNWKYGYAYAWGLMTGLGASIALYFKKKGWW